MASEEASEFVAECLWPGVVERDLRALDERVAGQARRFDSVDYLGSLLMREDEVVLCLFRGDLKDVRQVASAAEIPYDRILETTRSPWPLKTTG